MQILDTYAQREKNTSHVKNINSNQFDLVQQAEKRLKKFKTIVEIPDESKLLIANTMMLELFVLISQEGMFSLTSVRGTPKYYDNIYEHANEIRSYIEQIGFKRGLAIIDYIMALRIIRFKKMI